MTSAWTAAHAAKIDTRATATVPPVGDAVRPAGGEHYYYWDMWPVQHPDGTIANIGGREMWMALAAPDRGDPALRHFEARIRWLERTVSGWVDCGQVLPAHAAPYEREWAGCALLDLGTLTLYFTGAGTAERPGGYQQRLFEATAAISPDGNIRGWSTPRPSIGLITDDYCRADSHEGEPGRIKAFRDPAFFRDPADQSDYLVFTASRAGAVSQHNGAVGLAKRQGAKWALLPPLVHAVGVNNELERAHVVTRDGRYYLFWVTQSATFAPDVAAGPTGLYAMVADQLDGPWEPVNGSGLVLANPSSDPSRAYSWFVSAEGVASSFVDDSESRGFAGTPAPLLQLEFDGDRVTLAMPAYT